MNKSWLDRIAWASITAIVAAGVSWAAWVTMQLAEVPSTDETIELIQSRAPYVEDRKLIMQAVAESSAVNKQLAKAVDNNTRAIVQLQTIIEHQKRD